MLDPKPSNHKLNKEQLGILKEHVLAENAVNLQIM